MVKNPPANAGDSGDLGSIPGLGRSPGIGNSYPSQDTSWEAWIKLAGEQRLLGLLHAGPCTCLPPLSTACCLPACLHPGHLPGIILFSHPHLSLGTFFKAAQPIPIPSHSRIGLKIFKKNSLSHFCNHLISLSPTLQEQRLCFCQTLYPQHPVQHLTGSRCVRFIFVNE